MDSKKLPAEKLDAKTLNTYTSLWYNFPKNFGVDPNSNNYKTWLNLYWNNQISIDHFSLANGILKTAFMASEPYNRIRDLKSKYAEELCFTGHFSYAFIEQANCDIKKCDSDEFKEYIQKYLNSADTAHLKRMWRDFEFFMRNRMILLMLDSALDIQSKLEDGEEVESAKYSEKQLRFIFDELQKEELVEGDLEDFIAMYHRQYAKNTLYWISKPVHNNGNDNKTLIEMLKLLGIKKDFIKYTYSYFSGRGIKSLKKDFKVLEFKPSYLQDWGGGSHRHNTLVRIFSAVENYK